MNWSCATQLNLRQKLWWGQKGSGNHKVPMSCHVFLTSYSLCALQLYPEFMYNTSGLICHGYKVANIGMRTIYNFTGLLTQTLNALTNYMVLAITWTECCVPCMTFSLQVCYNSFPSQWPSYVCLLSHQLLQTAINCCKLPILHSRFIRKSRSQRYCGRVIDSWEHKAIYEKIWVWVMAKQGIWIFRARIRELWLKALHVLSVGM